jgi:hypothetical protein
MSRLYITLRVEVAPGDTVPGTRNDPLDLPPAFP